MTPLPRHLDDPAPATVDALVAVWPCDHGDVKIEPGKALPGYPCATCGATASTYISLDAIHELLREVSRDYAGAHVNAGAVTGTVRRRLEELR